jgi:hypothetical protein
MRPRPLTSALQNPLCIAALLLFALNAPAQVVGGVSAGSRILSPPPVDFSAQDQQEPPPGTIDRLHGVVLNSLTGKPVAHAVVQSGNQSFATFTDSEGRFSFDLRRPLASAQGANNGFSPLGGTTPSMTLIFLVRKPGYTQTQATIAVPLNTPADPEPVVALKLTPAASITGRVLMDPSLAAMQRPIVQLMMQLPNGAGLRWTTRSSTQMDTDGNFRFADLAAGDYRIVMSGAAAGQPAGRLPSDATQPETVRGMETASYPAATTTTDGAPTGFHLSTGETASIALATRAAAFYRVKVPVSDPESGPGGVGLQISPNEIGLRLQYDQRIGAFEGYLPSGAYRLMLTTGGQTRKTATLDLHVSGAPVVTAPVALAPAQQLQVYIRREFTGTEAQATSGSSQGNMQDVFLNLMPVDDNPYGGAQQAPRKPDSDPDVITLLNVMPGAYRVQANARIGYVSSLTAGGVDLLREPLVIGASGPSGPIQLTLRDDSASLQLIPANALAAAPPSTFYTDLAASVALAVCVPLDQPIRQPVFVALAFPGAGAASLQARTVPNLAPGRYLVFATTGLQRMNLQALPPETVKKLLPKGVVVELTAGQKAQVQVPLLAAEDFE